MLAFVLVAGLVCKKKDNVIRMGNKSGKRCFRLIISRDEGPARPALWLSENICGSKDTTKKVWLYIY